MRRIALHEYLGQIEGLLDDNRLPEAAAHCHFILQQYPRHIGVYLLFGRALLEQQLYDEAIDIFERLLSADPEDLISHAGLALAFSESRDLGRAIWHMERAFEVDPYNRAVQDELRKLYIARDGDAPPRLALTRPALARLHLRAALYQQAGAEFARLVNADPQRIDLQLALADALYRDSRVAEAADLCLKVLDTLPFCIKANAIVADAWLKDDRVDEAREHLRRVQDLTMLDRAHLDPDTTLGKALSNPRISLPESVPVEVLEDTLALTKELEETGAWPALATAVIVDGVTAPDWLHEIGSPDAAAVPERIADADERPGPDEFMDWLDEAEEADLSAPIEGRKEPSSEVTDTIEGFGIVAKRAEVSGTTEPSVMDDDLLEALHYGVESSDDIVMSVEADKRAITSTAGEFDAPLETSSTDTTLDEAEDRPVAEDQEVEAPVWENEHLLALDELRSFIDEDEDPAMADAGSPEWLDELTERTDVSEELPRWLYEAVGLDAAHSGQADALATQLPGEASPVVGEEQPGNPNLQKDFAQEDSGRRGDVGGMDDELSYLEDEMQGMGADPAVPDWLLEGSEVLDELPPGLLPSEGTGSAPESEQDAPMTWLDELSAQLGGTDEQGANRGTSRGGSREGEEDDSPTGATNK